MQKKFKISIDGHSYDVAVEEVSSDSAQSAPVAASFAPSVAVAAAVAAPVAAPAAAAAPAASAGDEVAPLAGVVESLAVTVGQVVAVGDKIATIEAMKMKTEVFAKGAGTVSAVAVKPGDPVDTGSVLLSLS